MNNNFSNNDSNMENHRFNNMNFQNNGLNTSQVQDNTQVNQNNNQVFNNMNNYNSQNSSFNIGQVNNTNQNIQSQPVAQSNVVSPVEKTTQPTIQKTIGSKKNINKSFFIKTIKIIVAIIIILLIIKFISKLIVSSSEDLKYLPKSSSNYDVICTRKNEGFNETYGLEEHKDSGYVGYDYVVVYSKTNGEKINENEANVEAAKTLVNNLKKSFISSDYSFKDGKLIINSSTINYSFSSAKKASDLFKNDGYSCK